MSESVPLAIIDPWSHPWRLTTQYTVGVCLQTIVKILLRHSWPRVCCEIGDENLREKARNFETSYCRWFIIWGIWSSYSDRTAYIYRKYRYDIDESFSRVTCPSNCAFIFETSLAFTISRYLQSCEEKSWRWLLVLKLMGSTYWIETSQNEGVKCELLHPYALLCSLLLFCAYYGELLAKGWG